MPRLNKRKNRKEWATIENAFMFGRALGADGILVVLYKQGERRELIYNPGPKKANAFKIKADISLLENNP